MVDMVNKFAAKIEEKKGHGLITMTAQATATGSTMTVLTRSKRKQL